MSFLSKLFGPAVPQLTAEELAEKLKFGKRPLVIDVRQPEEFRQGHIDGAKLIPLNTLYKEMKELSKTREIVCVCATGNRSRSAAKILMKAGFTVFDLKGGMAAWKQAKQPIRK